MLLSSCALRALRAACFKGRCTSLLLLPFALLHVKLSCVSSHSTVVTGNLATLL